MLMVDPVNYDITIPCGDTGVFVVTLTNLDGTPRTTPFNGAAVFSICEVSPTSKTKTERAKFPVAIVDNTATILITNAFSRDLKPGVYYWDARIVTDPEYDTDGNVKCGDITDEVHSLLAWRAGGMPKFTVLEVSGIV
ncbi:MAG: hypothetical protein RR893_12305 [Clostridia bacterium]